MNRLQKYLTWPGMEQQIVSEFQRELLLNNHKEILEIGTDFENAKGAVKLFVNGEEDDLRLLYKLYRPTKDGLKPIADFYRAFLA
jgi:hypothetical protein